MTSKTRRLTLMAMIAAMAYVIMLVGRIPVVMFLKYDPKDIIIAIGGFMIGPGAAALISVLVSLIEMVTVSETGIIGCVMNILSTLAFVFPAALFYHHKRTLRSAAVGLGVGAVAMTAVMLAWNYILTPIYMGYPRAAVAEMLIPVFLPFNLLKGLLNAGFTMLLYKPVSTALRRNRLISHEQEKPAQSVTLFHPVVVGSSIALIITCVILMYLLGHH
ncbi:MAG: ECF transporter S component [Clostridia bacterium]|nr:ECF transporter S component [Clostridia bacterium]